MNKVGFLACSPVTWHQLEVVVPATILGAALLLMTTACGNESSILRLDQEDIFTQEGTDQVDILWVVDNSNSMEEEQILVADGFARFIRAVGSSTVDFHIGLVTTDMDLGNEDRGKLVGNPSYLTVQDDYQDEFMSRVRVGIEGSDKERGLQAAYYALTSEEVADSNAGFLRESAVLAIVFVSDEDDCSDENALADDVTGDECYDPDTPLVSSKDYIDSFYDIKGDDGRVVVSSIVGPMAEDGCENTWPGHRYMAVAENLDGLVADICQTDYGDIMDDIGSRISGPTHVFYLTHEAVPDSIEVIVDEEQIYSDPEDGWQYDAEFAALRFDGDYVPELGSTIYVYYDIAG